MSAKDYLKALIHGQSVSQNPVHLNELKLLLYKMEHEEPAGTAAHLHYTAYTGAEERRKRAVMNRDNLTDDDHLPWQKFSDAGRFIDAIKLFRELTGCGLKEAKDTVDWWRSYRTVKYFF